MADKLTIIADAMANKSYDIMLEAETSPEQTRDEYVEQYRKFYTALAEVASDEMQSA